MRFRLSALFAVITALALVLAVVAPARLQPVELLVLLYAPLPTLTWIVLELLVETGSASRTKAFSSCLAGLAGTLLVIFCWFGWEQVGPEGAVIGLVAWALVTGVTWLPQFFVLLMLNRDLKSVDRRLARPVAGSGRSKSPAPPQDCDGH